MCILSMIISLWSISMWREETIKNPCKYLAVDTTEEDNEIIPSNMDTHREHSEKKHQQDAHTLEIL